MRTSGFLTTNISITSPTKDRTFCFAASKFDVDISPEELRRLMGLPDVQAFNEKVMEDMMTKLHEGAEGYDPMSIFSASVGSNMDLRFELTNIHIQCSVNCNQFGRGMPVEYDEFIKNKYGSGHYNWLNTKFLCHKPHPTLKEQFPTYQDIECEIKKYADILKSKGITPKLRW